MKTIIMALAAAGLFLASLNAHAEAIEVVRVLDVPQSRYQELSRLADFWGIDRRHDAVILAVDAGQKRSLEAMGFRIERDETRMASLEYARSFDAQTWRETGQRGIPGFPCYRTVDETTADLSAMASARPNLARWESIGQTWLESNGQSGGDDIHALVLGNQNSPHERAPFVLMAAQHARELTTAETATRFAEWLFYNYDTDPTARWLLDHRDIHIIAQQNPDGRREVEGGSDMWRKNSNLDHSNICGTGSDFQGYGPGVDLNRNSAYHFGGDSTSPNECHPTFPGPDAASEPETQAVQAYLDQVFERHRPGDPNDMPTTPVPDDADGLFISLHSFSELVLFPWEGGGSGSSNNAPNHDQLAWLGRRFGYFTGYEVGRDILYSAGGTMTDFAHGEFGVAAFTYEIGTEFQQSCTYFEQNMERDLLDALVYAAKAAARPYQAPSGPDVVEEQAVWNAQAGTLTLNGMADGSRFARGGVTEAPADDPVHDLAEIRASIGVPPSQAASTFDIAPDSTDPVSGFAGEFTPPQPIELPALVFFQASDTQGNVGVPEAVWLVEQRAAVSPSSLGATIEQGQSEQLDLTIGNVGSEPLTWSIDADLPAGTRGGHDPSLDETLDLDDFVLPGNGTASQSFDGGIASRGQAVGFTFEGDVAGISGTSTYASDMIMTVTSPYGASYTVGGFQTDNPDWNFQGSGSDDDGSYTSTHVGEDIFGTGGVADAGAWQLDFEHSYNDAMDWSDVSITLHKQQPPECVDPSGVTWITVAQASGTLSPGDDQQVGITLDAASLQPGQHQALLCIVTDDPIAELVVVDVTVEVTGVEQRVFRDRFEDAPF